MKPASLALCTYASNVAWMLSAIISNTSFRRNTSSKKWINGWRVVLGNAFHFEALCNIPIPLPSIEQQHCTATIIRHIKNDSRRVKILQKPIRNRRIICCQRCLYKHCRKQKDFCLMSGSIIAVHFAAYRRPYPTIVRYSFEPQCSDNKTALAQPLKYNVDCALMG